MTIVHPSTTAEDAVSATAWLWTVHVQHGELKMPPRLFDRLDGGPVRVIILRDDVTVAEYEATLGPHATLTGIEWPHDVAPMTRVVVTCPRGGGDVTVALPPTPEPVPFVDPTPVDVDDASTAAAEIVERLDPDAPALPKRLPGESLPEQTVITEMVVHGTLPDDGPPTEIIAAVKVEADDPVLEVPSWPGDAASEAAEDPELDAFLRTLSVEQLRVLADDSDDPVPIAEDEFGLYGDDASPDEASDASPEDDDGDGGGEGATAWTRLRRGIEWARRNWTPVRVGFAIGCVAAFAAVGAAYLAVAR